MFYQIYRFFKGLIFPAKVFEKIDLKEIFCNAKEGDPIIKRFNTSAVGVEHSNIDGSNRQEALNLLKPDDKVRLIWDAGSQENKSIVYLVRGGKGQRLKMENCFGRLSEKAAADVVRWTTRENIMTSARVVKIVGGTRKRPKLGCVVELTTYPGPEPKS